MNYYFFYNAPLINTAIGNDELSPGFVDDSMMLAIGDMLAQCHDKLRDMMEWPGSGFSWSLMHNSSFELSKTALINFPRSYRDAIPGTLRLDKSNADSSVSTSLTQPMSLYKYLGVIFDPKLCWMLQHKKSLAATSFWASCINCLLRSASSVSTAGAKQLYNTVAVPRFTYGAEVWYTYVHKPPSSAKLKGSVSITNKIKTAQRNVAAVVTGSLRTTVGDVLDMHTYILPIDLLFSKLLFRAALRLCSFPKSHLRHNQLRSYATKRAKRHLSLVHHLLQFTDIDPKQIEMITPVWRSPSYSMPFDLIIPKSKNNTFSFALLAETIAPVHVYSDGSGFEGGIGASAILYVKDWLVKTL